MKAVQATLLGAGVLLLVAAVAWSLRHEAATGDPLPGHIGPQELESILNPSNDFPAVAATVNGETIPGTALATSMEIARVNSSTLDDAARQDGAMEFLIGNELLVQEARDRGLFPSDDEALAAAVLAQERLETMPLGDRAMAEQLYGLQGYDVTHLADEPRFIEAEARSIALARIKNEARLTLPSSQQQDIALARAAVDNLVRELASQADINIFVDSSFDVGFSHTD